MWHLNKKIIPFELSIRAAPLFFILTIIAIACGLIYEYMLAYLSIVIHEAGHLLTALLLRKKVYSIILLPVGFNAIIQEGANIFERLIIHLSGPLSNIGTTIICILINSLLSQNIIKDILGFFISLNIYLAVFNLLPISPLDGGNVTREVLVYKFGYRVTNRIMSMLSWSLSLLLILVGIAQIALNAGNISFLVAGIFIFFCIGSNKMEVSLMNIRNLTFRKNRIEKKGIYPARDLVVTKSVRLGDVIKHMDFDRFHIIYVLNDSMRIIGIFTEQQIVDYLAGSSQDITFEEYINVLI